MTDSQSELLPTEPRTRVRVVSVSGNPRPGSRTERAAAAAAEHVARLLRASLPVTRIELADHAHEIFAVDHPAIDLAITELAGSAVAIVATPVYKASYTGLLKAFLDLYGHDGLAGVVAVPLVVAGNPAHALVGDVHLRALLVELGAVVPTRALTILESQLAELDPVLDAWSRRAAEPLLRAVGPGIAGGAAR